MTTIFTGLQPTGTLHIGNYLGSILTWHALVDSVKDAQAYLMIADAHAITVKQDPEMLRRKVLELAAIMLASGVDLNKHILFPQSQNPDHMYLGWVFTCLTPMGWLDRMTQFKEKKQKLEGYKEAVSAGLYTYPALMAADILLYDTDMVPVGVDQKQHVELTVDVANRFNSLYGETFKVPEFRTNKETTKVFDLQDPTKKMSKSDKDDAGRIALTDSADVIKKKIMKAVTDNDTVVAYDMEHKPGISNLLAIMAAVTKSTVTSLTEEYNTGAGYGAFKRAVAEAVVSYLEPFQKKMNDYLADETELKRILDEGAAKAYAVSHPKLLQAIAKIGIYLHG